MKFRGAFLLAFGLLLSAGSVPAQDSSALAQDAVKRSDDAVVAVIDGRPIRYAEIRAFLDAMPAQNRAAALQSPEDFLRQYALMGKLSALAEERKLDEETPYKQQLEYNRKMVLSTAGLNLVSQEVRVSDAETRAFFKANEEDYAEVKVKVIYLPFNNAMPKPGEIRQSMTESEALEFSTKLVGELRNGADFVEMVRKHSKDEGSAKRDGDFATLKKSDQIPEAVKESVFPLNEGDISDPVRQPNGFYIFRVEQKRVPPYDEVAATINTKVHDQKFRKKLDEIRGAIEVSDIEADLLKP
jgi:peptidyl-prolyl cis-trans isomerase C